MQLLLHPVCATPFLSLILEPCFFNLFLSCLFVFVPDYFPFCYVFGVLADVSTEEGAVNTINDVLSELGVAENTVAAEQGAPSVEGCDSVLEPLCSLMMSEMQS